MRNYSLATLKKQLERARRKYSEEVTRPSVLDNWGVSMRRVKLASTTKLDRLRDRVRELERQIREREASGDGR